MKGYENSKVPGLFCLMKDRKIKAKQLAEILGVSEGNVSDWKSGKSAPSAAIRKIIADYLGVTVNDLLAEEHRVAASSKTKKEKAPIESDEGGEESIKDYLHQIQKPSRNGRFCYVLHILRYCFLWHLHNNI